MADNKMKSDRRMGPAGSENWHAMLDGAEYILREEGHARLTSRRIAECVGVKQRLVYYYFRSMDELIVDLFRRLSDRELQRLREASESRHALRDIWNTNVSSTDARLISEFMALANRLEGLKIEVIKFIQESRAIEIEAIGAALARKSIPNSLPASALAIVAASVALTVSREAQLGIDMGHADIITVVEGFLAALEP